MEKSKARVICNPTSRGGAYDPDEIRDQLDGLDVEWVQTHGPGEVMVAAQEWREGLLIVAGGDGTINDVVNGLGRAGFPDGVTLGILPAGTGNDLAATLCIPEDPDLAKDVILQNRGRKLDVARVSSEGVGERYFLNVATGGLGAEISNANEGEFKKRWGKLSYLRASLEVARDFDVRQLTLYLDGEPRDLRAVNVVVGNCRYAGGGWLAAPKANPEDGLLDVVVIETLGTADLLELAPASLAKVSYLDKEGVFFARAKEIRVETQPPGLEFTTDGEVIGNEPAEFSVIPNTLKVLVGPEYAPEPAG
ncbi:MAG TPA: diacylglycerol kinase family protein [Rubrobacter sp.]|nr:diacylglycerol kinase family protein [Rubrobacter sp.]